MHSILVVDDDEIFRTRLAHALASRGYEVFEAADAKAAVARASEESPELVVVDLRLPDGSGLEVVQALRAIDPQTRIVVLTSYGSIATALDAVRLGAIHYLTKPADVDAILRAFQRADGDPVDLAVIPDEPPSLARVEWEHLNRVLADCGGNISEAARRLGLHRRSLQRKLSKYPPRR